MLAGMVQMISTGISDQSGIPLIGGYCLENRSDYCEAEFWFIQTMCYIGELRGSAIVRAHLTPAHAQASSSNVCLHRS